MGRDDITVITPTIPPRAKTLLPRAVVSVARQTYAAAAHIICIDSERQGAPATRQRALDLARTEWVAPLDDDDEFTPYHLKSLLEYAKEHDLDYAYAWFRVVNPKGQVYPEDPIFPPGHFENEFDYDNPIETTITVLVKRELAQSVGYHELRRGEGNTGEDYNFLLGCIKAGAKIGHLVKHTWLWHHHGANSSGRPTW